MKDLTRVNPHLRAALESFPPLTISTELLPIVRAGILEMSRDLPLPPGAPEPQRISIPGPPGAPDVGVVVCRPDHDKTVRPAVLHMHGGGYVAGSPQISVAKLVPLACELGCVIVSVDYRLAPETPHPGPVEDCYAALKWLHGHARELGVDPGRIGVAGESAGGGLAAALALLARDRGEVRLAFQHLTYPMLDDRTCTGADPHPYTGEHVWNAESNRFGWRSLLGREPGGADVDIYAAPARATDLVGLPPTYISVGALDLFLEEDVDYAMRLTRADVPVELHVYPGAFHGYDAAVDAPVTVASRRDSRAAMARFLAEPG